MLRDNPNQEQRKSRFLIFRRKLYKYLFFTYGTVAAVFSTLVIAIDTKRYLMLFAGLIFLSILTAIKNIWEWKFVRQDDLDVDLEIRTSKKKLTILSFCLIVTFAGCIACLFFTEWRSYFSLLIPLTIWVGGEYLVTGIDYFQLCILEDELQR